MRINLLPEQYRPQPQVKALNVIILLSAVVLILGVGTFALVEYVNYNGLVNENNMNTQKLLSYQSDLAEAHQKEALLNEVEQREKEIQKIHDMYQLHQTVIREIANALPNDVWLTNATIEMQGAVKISGSTMTFSQLGIFLNQLNDQPDFNSAHFNDITQNIQNDIPLFNFNLEMKTGRNSLAYAENKGH